MVFGKSKTQSTNIKWIVEVYPFESSVPSKDDFSGFSGPAVLIGSKGTTRTINQLIKKLKKAGDIDAEPDQPETAFGLKNVTITRTKGNPDNECELFFVGRLPKKLYTGVWVLVTSVSRTAGGQEKMVNRFVGQVSASESSYVVTEDGLFTSQHTLTVRE